MIPEQDIVRIDRIVRRYLNPYEYKSADKYLVYACDIYDIKNVDFTSFLKEMKSIGYIYMLKKEKGEYLLYVMRIPEPKKSKLIIHIVLFFATILSTVAVGMGLTTAYFHTNLISLRNVIYSFIFFSVPLIGILSIHETGHYITAKKNGIRVSYPYFIPMPFTIIGTLGAFISLREPVPNRKTLMEIGAAGPLLGFLMAIPVTIVGLILTGIYTVPAPDKGVIFLGTSIMYETLQWITNLIVPIQGNIIIHPTAFAGWVGLLVTAINLLPVGQLDGGHIVRAMLGDKAKYANYIAVGIMIFLGFFYTGWFIFAFLIFILGIKHPSTLNDITPLDNLHKMLGIIMLIIMILCFVPIPLST